MIGIVIVTHGRLAQEIISAMEHMVGPQTHLRAVCVGPEDDVERRQREIAAQIEILQAQLASEKAEVAILNREVIAREDQLAADRVAMEESRQAGTRPDEPALKPAKKPKK